MGKYTSLIKKTGLMPALTINSPENAKGVAEAFLAAGQPVAEITMRTDSAPKAIEIIRQNTDLSIGAGTVIDTETAKCAIESGAEFIVCPGFYPKVIEYALDKKIEIIPGVATPTEIGLALSYNIKVMKLFPADLLGGTRFLKAMEGPYGEAMFIPMGGINTDNAKDYISCPNVFALGGPWMAKPEIIDRQDFEYITKATEEILRIIETYR